MCGRKLLDTSLAEIIHKKSLKLFARVKMYIQVTNVHALVRGLQNRTRQTSMRSCAVRNELIELCTCTDMLRKVIFKMLVCCFFCFFLHFAGLVVLHVGVFVCQNLSYSYTFTCT
jgi:hypothetical protein